MQSVSLGEIHAFAGKRQTCAEVSFVRDGRR